MTLTHFEEEKGWSFEEVKLQRKLREHQHYYDQLTMDIVRADWSGRESARHAEHANYLRGLAKKERGKANKVRKKLCEMHEIPWDPEHSMRAVL